MRRKTRPAPSKKEVPPLDFQVEYGSDPPGHARALAAMDRLLAHLVEREQRRAEEPPSTAPVQGKA